ITSLINHTWWGWPGTRSARTGRWCRPGVRAPVWITRSPHSTSPINVASCYPPLGFIESWVPRSVRGSCEEVGASHPVTRPLKNPSRIGADPADHASVRPRSPGGYVALDLVEDDRPRECKSNVDTKERGTPERSDHGALIAESEGLRIRHEDDRQSGRPL